MFKGLRNSQGEFTNYEPSGHYMYHQFNIQQFYVLPTQTVFVFFAWIWEQTAIISLHSINWLVCITETESVYCSVRAETLNETDCFVLVRLTTLFDGAWWSFHAHRLRVVSPAEGFVGLLSGYGHDWWTLKYGCPACSLPQFNVSTIKLTT